MYWDNLTQKVSSSYYISYLLLVKLWQVLDKTNLIWSRLSQKRVVSGMREKSNCQYPKWGLTGNLCPAKATWDFTHASLMDRIL